MTTRPKANSLMRIKQDNKLRHATPSLKTETTAPSSDEEASPEKLRVKVKVKKNAADSINNHRSLNALELEQAIRSLQKNEPTEKKNSRSSDGHSQLKDALERLHQSFPDVLTLENANYENIVRKSSQQKSRSGSRRRTTRDRSTERSARTSRTLQDPPATPRTMKSSHTRQREQSTSPLRKPRVPKETARSMSPKRISSKRTDLVTTTTTPLRIRPESPRRVSSRVQEPKECRRSVSRTRSNHLEYFTPADVAFPDPWADVRKESSSSDNRVNDLVLQSGIITASQLKQLLNAGFTFNGPEFLDAFP